MHVAVPHGRVAVFDPFGDFGGEMERVIDDSYVETLMSKKEPRFC